MNVPIIIAAGGLVWNENNELLMIFRRGKWDLPKGKLDEGERIEQCAIREVMEETGLQQVEISSFIGITKHEYFDTYLQKNVVKESHWYAMKANSADTLVAQTSEDITDIQWCNQNNILTYLSNSYKNIIDIITQYNQTI